MTPNEVKDTVKQYSSYLNIPLPKKMFFYQKNYANYLESKWHDTKYADQVRSGEILGSNIQMGKDIFINLDKLNTKELTYHRDMTIVHELLHTKHPEIEHGAKFRRYIRSIQKKKYPPSNNWWDKFMDYMDY